MAKEFAPRVSKKNRKTVDLSHKVNRDIYKILDNTSFLKGAEIETLSLSEIVVKDQVRTKFNDSSLRELGENIKLNGLIQPLVVHREKGKFVLICGERRFRAMTLIDMLDAPCFILKGKNSEELMAIQFSENSSREQLHYIDKADGIYEYQKATGSSERKIVVALGISKTEVHRSLLLAKLSKNLKEAAKKHNTEKYVLLEIDALASGSSLRKKLEQAVASGEITKRAQIKKAIRDGGNVLKIQSASKVSKRRKPVSASVFMKAMQNKLAAQAGDSQLDKETIKALKSLMNETRDLVDM